MKHIFGAWAPDSAGHDTGLLSEARNVYPYAVGYGPISALAAFSTTALPSKCLGLAYAKTSSGGWVVFAGTATKLYRLVDTVWTDYSRLAGGDYNATDDDHWSFTQFGSQLIAVNINDAPQVIDVDTGAANFSALGGSPPQARYVTTVGDFVVLASLSGDNTRKVRNSAINDSTGWTVGTNLCDEQEFPDGGRVTGIAGGEFGWVVQEKAIRRMIFQPGSDYAFRYELAERERGCAAGYGLVAVANTIFFLSDDGFYSFGPNGLTAIGAEVVNDWFGTNSDPARFFDIIAFSDPFGPRIAWAFYNSDGDANFTRLLIYNWKSDRWSYAIVEGQYWANYATAGVTLESLDSYGDLDTGVPFSLDSRVFQGGRPGMAAVNASGYLAFLDSTTALDALIRTGPMHVIPGQRAKNFDLEPLIQTNGATVTVRVGKQELTSSAISYTDAISPSTRSGMVRCRASGRIHVLELNVTQSSGTRWTLAQGFDIEATPDGTR